MLAGIVLSLCLGAGEPANPLLQELLEKGLPIPQGPTLKLTPPYLPPGLAAPEQRAALQKICAIPKKPLDLDQFLKNSVDAPFSYKIDSVEDAAGQRVGQKVDIYFVAYSTLDKVLKEDALNQLIGMTGKKRKEKDDVQPLKAADLEARGLKMLQGPNLEEQYARIDFILLEKVKISGVTRNVKTQSAEGAVLAMQLDPRFENDKEFPNRWRSYDPLANEDKAFGPPQNYTGLGGYAQVTRLHEPKGALLFEVHVVLHEPEAWFGSSNILRSRLFTLFQENIRTLRRKLGRE